ncbi:hypothetical protein BACCAP_04057 [Pseudoflavonifractor capillosus ATCC 29799]|uniref:Uncharacterized protein n=1 Tax=Pseudoflavonifractor capillosus ATCC 29799 TaxID=411467 RepID=A6P0P6_9FIRM|nr:hypothetical protein BACCAP_04057 [Pseudoflavonifractor capillosus ATCC 29799]
MYYFYNKKSNRTRFWTVRTRYTAPDRPTGPVLTAMLSLLCQNQIRRLVSPSEHAS